MEHKVTIYLSSEDVTLRWHIRSQHVTRAKLLTALYTRTKTLNLIRCDSLNCSEILISVSAQKYCFRIFEILQI